MFKLKWTGQKMSIQKNKKFKLIKLKVNFLKIRRWIITVYFLNFLKFNIKNQNGYY